LSAARSWEDFAPILSAAKLSRALKRNRHFSHAARAPLSRDPRDRSIAVNLSRDPEIFLSLALQTRPAYFKSLLRKDFQIPRALARLIAGLEDAFRLLKHI